MKNEAATKKPLACLFTYFYCFYDKYLYLCNPFFNYRESSLLAISLDDLNIEIIDIMTLKTVRKFQNVHKGPLTDMTYSNDSRWLLTSSLDKTIKVWDVPSGSLVDHIGFTESVTSLTMSPTSEFLATTHLNNLGIYLWSNKSLYGYKCLKPLNPEECQPIQIRMPTVKQSQEDILADTLEDLEMADGDEEEQVSFYLFIVFINVYFIYLLILGTLCHSTNSTMS